MGTVVFLFTILAFVAGEDNRLDVNPTILDGEGAVQISWHINFATWDDYIALYPAYVLNTTGSIPEPIKYKKAYGNKTITYPPNHGTTQMYLINRRVEYIIAYVTGEPPFFSILAVSTDIKMKRPFAPLQPHLVVPHNNPQQMALTWNAKATSKPVWKIGTAPGSYQWTIPASATTYKRTDMCDIDEFQPAGRQGWIDPGFMLTATWSPPHPSTKYFYTFGDELPAYGFSEKEYTFYSSPPSASRGETVMIGFGDMGQTPSDGSYQHSWDWGDRGEVPTLNTSATIFSLMTEAQKKTQSVFVMHIGDISYAVGFESEWDQFMHLIEPIASRVPYFTGIGNHEVGYSKSYWSGTDSGGECGIPYLARFPFVSEKIMPPDAQTPWYSFQYGLVSVVVMSSEHDYRTTSPQYTYLKSALAAIDRSVTPWVVFTGHRCMFWNYTYAKEMQESLEPLLSQYKVDIALWGHSHLYTRTCAMYKFECKQGGAADGGITHFLIGTAGYHLSGDVPKGDWVKSGSTSVYGVGQFTFHSATHATVEFVNVATKKVVDSVTLTRPS